MSVITTSGGCAVSSASAARAESAVCTWAPFASHAWLSMSSVSGWSSTMRMRRRASESSMGAPAGLRLAADLFEPTLQGGHAVVHLLGHRGAPCAPSLARLARSRRGIDRRARVTVGASGPQAVLALLAHPRVSLTRQDTSFAAQHPLQLRAIPGAL